MNYEDYHRNSVLTKPLRSAKNGHEMRKFAFNGDELQHCSSGQQLKKLKKM